MKENRDRYLVVGPPRGGFTLLLSILATIYRDRGLGKPRYHEIADPYIAIAGLIRIAGKPFGARASCSFACSR